MCLILPFNQNSPFTFLLLSYAKGLFQVPKKKERTSKPSASAILFFYQFHNLRKTLRHIVISARTMGNQTVCTILYPVFCILKIPAAFFPQRVQRAVTKQAIKALRVFYRVAWKEFACPMAEEFKVFRFFHCLGFLHLNLFFFAHKVPPYSLRVKIARLPAFPLSVFRSGFHKKPLPLPSYMP